jgi:CRP/FNR family transcriptional regulator, cyclic AMP receptor protein
MLNADLVEGFRKAGIERKYVANEPIVLQNEPSTGMYLLLSGEVKVLRRTPQGTQIEVATMSAGQTMGEISLLLGQPHAATVVAKTDIEASLLTPSRLEELRRDEPDLALHLFEILAYTLAGHVMQMNRQLDEARKQVQKLEEQVNKQTVDFSYY